jgi:sigma-E factor negative regulatory protein RseB
MRHGLLMTAVATVTVPGLLAVFGVVSHGRAPAEASVSAAGGAATSEAFPLLPAQASAAVRGDVAAIQRASGLPVTVFSRMTSGQQVMGMRLLSQAADAGLAASYQGTEQISESSVNGSVQMTSQVWHRGGGGTLVQTSSGPLTTTAASAATGSPEGVFGVTKTLVALLGQHYVALYRGSGSAAGRPAAVVELYRFDGSLAARYWLDRQTMLPLRRETFGTADKVISEDSFVRVQFGPLADAQAARTAASAPAWVTAAAPAQFRASLAGQGWQVPGTLSAGLTLYAAAWTQTANGRVVDLEYSDGLSVVSLFVQQGNLASSLPGWQPVRVAGQQAFVSGHTLTWARLGFVYTMIADAPAATVRQVVGALPASGQDGLLDRLRRGLDRLAQVVNPFS